MFEIIPQALSNGGSLRARLEAHSKTAFQMHVSCDRPEGRFDIMDVAPWGTVMPLDALEYPGWIFYDVEIETQGMPAGTVLGMRWSPEDGNNVHILIHTLDGSGSATTRLRVQDHWLLEAQGQYVLIESEVSLPDGSVQIGRSFKAYVSRQMVYGNIDYPDLIHYGELDPDKFPEGIRCNIQPIVNILPYHTIIIRWMILGIIGGLDDEIVIEWETSLPAAPGEGYTFVVPPEVYRGHDLSRFRSVVVVARHALNLLPSPNPEYLSVREMITFDIPV